MGVRFFVVPVAVLTLTLAVVKAQVPVPTAKGSVPQGSGTQLRQRQDGLTPQAGERAEIARRLAAIEGLAASNATRLAVIEAHSDAVDSSLAEIKMLASKGPSIFTILVPAISVLLGVLVGGYINEQLQKKRLVQEMTIALTKAEHDKGLAEAKAQQERGLAEMQSKLEIGSAVVDWELKQLSVLYGPMRALLGQSLALHSQMTELLVRADDNRFRFDSMQSETNGGVFQIRTASGWERFRTVMHLSEVYGKDLGVEIYFDEIVSIGARLEKIIQEQAGFARAEEKEIMVVFAKYLAHFAVLKNVHEEAKSRITSRPDTEGQAIVKAESGSSRTIVDVAAVFPEDIQRLINDGFQAITKDIEDWRRKAASQASL